MLKIAALGLWMPIATVFSSYATTQWLMERQSGAVDQVTGLGGLDYETVKPVNVPMIADGALQGYVVAQLVFTADANALRNLPVPPHPFLVDETFRRLYADTSLDFSHLERYDLDSLTVQLRDAANKRLGEDVVKEVLIEEFNYFAKDDVISH